MNKFRSSQPRLQGTIAFALVAAITAPAHATDGYFQHGVGVKGKGTGGVAVALPQDATSIGANPATATEIDHRVDIGVEVFVPDRSAQISGNAFGLNGNYNGNGANPFVLGDVAYVRPVSDKVTVGIVFFANGGMNTVYETNPFGPLGGQGDAGVDLKQAFIMPTAAVKVAEGHSVGASVVGVVQSFKATGVQPFAGFSADPANFTNRGTDWSVGVGFKLGYYGKLTEGFSVGAFYQSKVGTGKFDKYAGLFADAGGFDVPESWGVGAAVDVSDKLTVGVDYKKINYDSAPSVGNSIASLFQGVPFGASDGPGFGWSNIDVLKVGAVWQASDKFTLRAGYGRSENPIPANETFLNILAPGVVQDHFTLGGSVQLSSKAELSAYVMRAPTNRVSGAGSIPPMLGGGEADIFLAETSGGLSLGFTF
ncbi:OmpP1/FadL family transporter [Parerythrobacter aestuarii]|uniref:OmpP1/FadL family transporter n=1 Tax=Parerythrobacter aestuarii TaxID=3020909 RepID=UPI0024DE8E6C|nr:outer membrane protein transport protein [Parerythrobacter aestuarii]